mmetsp:Transcript_99/g.362  ORF Transcript_99/g.362 Transcript_99/m.362 type:complete len:296 (+) Transcript_99:124-1011(+)
MLLMTSARRGAASSSTLTVASSYRYQLSSLSRMIAVWCPPSSVAPWCSVKPVGVYVTYLTDDSSSPPPPPVGSCCSSSSTTGSSIVSATTRYARRSMTTASDSPADASVGVPLGVPRRRRKRLRVKNMCCGGSPTMRRDWSSGIRSPHRSHFPPSTVDSKYARSSELTSSGGASALVLDGGCRRIGRSSGIALRGHVWLQSTPLTTPRIVTRNVRLAHSGSRNTTASAQNSCGSCCRKNSQPSRWDARALIGAAPRMMSSSARSIGAKSAASAAASSARRTSGVRKSRSWITLAA